MTDSWRFWCYPIGLIAQIAFGARFLIQWYESEKQGRSVPSRLFWKMSLVGSTLLIIHSYIQAYFPICLLQSLNAVIFWRNLNFLQAPEKRVNFSQVIAFFVLAACTIFLLFLLQVIFFDVPWISAPWSIYLSSPQKVSNVIHAIGLIGIFCYSLRFWVQWWQTEQQKKSVLSFTFWYLSLLGAAISTVYFFILFDWVNLMGAILSFIPYSRNLWLLRKASHE